MAGVPPTSNSVKVKKISAATNPSSGTTMSGTDGRAKSSAGKKYIHAEIIVVCSDPDYL